jgi:hypothetical protein
MSHEIRVDISHFMIGFAYNIFCVSAATLLFGGAGSHNLSIVRIFGETHGFTRKQRTEADFWHVFGIVQK